MILHENRLPADDSHEISCIICYFRKSSKVSNCRQLHRLYMALQYFEDGDGTNECREHTDQSTFK